MILYCVTCGEGEKTTEVCGMCWETRFGEDFADVIEGCDCPRMVACCPDCADEDEGEAA